MESPKRIANMIIGMNGDDRHGRLQADEVLAPAPLEDHDHDAVRGADAQQVQQRRLQRDEQRPEHQREQQERQQNHCADEQRKSVLHSTADVAPGGGLPADVSARAVGPFSTCGRTSARSRSMVVDGGGVLRRTWWGSPIRVVTDRSAAHLRREPPMQSPSRPRWPLLAGRRTPESSEMSTATTSGPLTPGPKPDGEQVVGPAFRPDGRAARPHRCAKSAAGERERARTQERRQCLPRWRTPTA